MRPFRRPLGAGYALPVALVTGAQEAQPWPHMSPSDGHAARPRARWTISTPPCRCRTLSKPDLPFKVTVGAVAPHRRKRDGRKARSGARRIGRKRCTDVGDDCCRPGARPQGAGVLPLSPTPPRHAAHASDRAAQAQSLPHAQAPRKSVRHSRQYRRSRQGTATHQSVSLFFRGLSHHQYLAINNVIPMHH